VHARERQSRTPCRTSPRRSPDSCVTVSGAVSTAAPSAGPPSSWSASPCIAPAPPASGPGSAHCPSAAAAAASSAPCTAVPGQPSTPAAGIPAHERCLALGADSARREPCAARAAPRPADNTRGVYERPFEAPGTRPTQEGEQSTLELRHRVPFSRAPPPGETCPLESGRSASGLVHHT
jgi:hypothetical protein